VVLDSYSKYQKYALAGVVDAVFWVLFVGTLFFLGFPTSGIAVGIAVVLHLLGGAAWYHVRDTGRFPGYSTTRKEQLSEEEVRRLVEWGLQFKEGYYPARNEGGIEPAVAPSDDKEDAVRLYKYEFEPMNLSGRATVLVDMEQELSVDLDDYRSKEKAWKRIRNKKIVKSWMNVEYEAEVEKKRKSLGRSKSPMIRTVRNDGDERVVEERPAALPTPQNQGSSNEVSESSS
jgi:hypothetical protein